MYPNLKVSDGTNGALHTCAARSAGEHALRWSAPNLKQAFGLVRSEVRNVIDYDHQSPQSKGAYKWQTMLGSGWLGLARLASVAR